MVGINYQLLVAIVGNSITNLCNFVHICGNLYPCVAYDTILLPLVRNDTQMYPT
ncbi:hypothetical protein SAMN05216480_111135 [Pustulibacterium marinum]|uniref:Uncharacterized protein n=1 Tax=Pustulibacterium marinum TaxID=1224947 RepID=A0A1I7HXW8_9FLAO|nr:hypothetical protein SAMN05216480_111135 [Pustulibacterium marinum]